MSLQEVEKVSITILMDNSTDFLLTDSAHAKRHPLIVNEKFNLPVPFKFLCYKTTSINSKISERRIYFIEIFWLYSLFAACFSVGWQSPSLYDFPILFDIVHFAEKFADAALKPNYFYI